MAPPNASPGAARGAGVLTTPEVLALTKVPPSTLNYWVQKGLVSPSHAQGAGKRYPRYWSPRDLVLVRIVKALREAGCPLQQVIRAQAALDRVWDTDLDEVVLYWDGHEVMARRWDEMIALIRIPGQEALHIVATSVAAWKVEAESAADDRRDVQQILDRRAKRQLKYPKSVTPTQRLTGDVVRLETD